MASALSVAKDKGESFLTKKVGPVPVWGILGAAVAGLGVWYFKFRK